MISKRYLALLTLILIAAMLVVGCAATEAPAEPTKAAAEPTAAPEEPEEGARKIGFSVYDMQYGFFQDMEAGTREAAEEAGYEYTLVDQKSSESTMVASTMDLLNQGVNALIISPFKPDAMGPIVDAAKEKGVPVVINDIGGGGTDYDVIVISDNYNGGVMAADEMDRLISAAGKPTKVASITCEPSAVYAARRNEGFEAKMNELGYEVVATLSGNSRMEEGYKVMQDILSANPDVAGVFSCNDPMAVGAAQAIADAGKSGSTDIYVLGFNADEIALEAIKAGTMAGTIQQVPFEMGKMTVDLATQLMDGETLAYDNDAEREIFVPVNLITSANVGDLLSAEPEVDLTGKKVGFSVYDMQYGFFQDMEAGTREAAEGAGYDYVLVDQKSSESTMVASTMDLLNQGVDALIISPFKPDAMGPIVDAAKEKGVPVVINDIGGGGTDYDVIVISDNYNGGVMAADEMDRLISAAGKPTKVASITCEPSAVYAARRNEGFEAKMNELGYEVVATLSGNSRMEEGYKVMQDILSANPDVAGVFSCNDPMAVGAAQAIADAGKSGSTDIYVVGFNADEIALEAIKAGTMAGTIQQVPFEMGKMTVDLATQLMLGESLTYDNDAEREIFVPVNLITPTNVDELLGGAPAADMTGSKIGFSVYDMQYGFFQDMEAGTREAAEEAGYDYVLVDQKSSESTMVASTMDLLNQGVDALIISPFKPDAMGPVVDAAKEKGVPVVINDIGGGGTDYDVIVISDNYNGGVMAADEMDRLISAAGKPTKVASITCEPSAVYAARRNEGFEAKMNELGYEVVATLSGNSRMEEGYKVMQDILSANPDVAGVFSCNDPMAVGAAQAIADAGKSGSTDIYVIGFNADEIALEAIKAGTMAGTIQQVPFEMGKMTVDLATQLLNGETLAYDNDAEREIFVPVNLITIANVDELLNP